MAKNKNEKKKNQNKQQNKPETGNPKLDGPNFPATYSETLLRTFKFQIILNLLLALRFEIKVVARIAGFFQIKKSRLQNGRRDFFFIIS